MSRGKRKKRRLPRAEVAAIEQVAMAKPMCAAGHARTPLYRHGKLFVCDNHHRELDRRDRQEAGRQHVLQLLWQANPIPFRQELNQLQGGG